MGVVRSGHFWQLGSIASLATGGEILVAFWPKCGLRSNLRLPNFKIFPRGSIPPDPPSLFTLRTLWPYQSKIAGSGPALTPFLTSFISTSVMVTPHKMRSKLWGVSKHPIFNSVRDEKRRKQRRKEIRRRKIRYNTPLLAKNKIIPSPCQLQFWSCRLH